MSHSRASLRRAAVTKFGATKDYSGLFTPHPDNTFLVKASYWISL